ncbi:MAG TPA: FAD-dependent oxidoreductase [Jiangellales bacterium]|nr:FAD-dependent oxidoreductase [Jiangellales bacterium]
MGERVVVVGGDAAGMSAASQASRTAAATGRDLDVVVLERGSWTSYSACGIPYWVAGDVDGPDGLVARTPEEHRANGLDVRTRTEAVGLDLDARTVEARDVDSGEAGRIGFDQLVVATGARPARPDLPGIDAAGVHGVQTLGDGAALIDRLDSEQPRRAVVVGGGYIGIEMAEAFVRRGLDVTLVDQAAEPMSTLDPDMGRLVRKAMQSMGITVVTGAGVDGFETRPDGRVAAVAAAETTYEADVVVLGLGVQPESTVAGAAGIPLGASGGIRVDLRMAVPGYDGVWAAGDCVESFDRVSQTWAHVPLGTHANKQGRVLGTNLGGGYATFPGIVRTAVSKVCDLEIARTGLREVDATRAGFRFVAEVVRSTTRAGYFPGAEPLTLKVIAEDGTGRLLGAQVVGREGSAKRVDALALALWNEMTVHDLAMVDLSYAPPFAPVWDPVLIAARKAADRLRG